LISNEEIKKLQVLKNQLTWDDIENEFVIIKQFIAESKSTKLFDYLVYNSKTGQFELTPSPLLMNILNYLNNKYKNTSITSVLLEVLLKSSL
jgi:hypothetical protein